MMDYDEMKIVTVHRHPPMDGCETVLVIREDCFGRHFPQLVKLDEAC